MNNQRKIKAEIEKVHKKIRDGFEVFQSLWDKVDQAVDHSSKTRWTSELKKELKKLQRLRDMLKQWLSNGVIKVCCICMHLCLCYCVYLHGNHKTCCFFFSFFLSYLFFFFHLYLNLIDRYLVWLSVMLLYARTF